MFRIDLVEYPLGGQHLNFAALERIEDTRDRGAVAGLLGCELVEQETAIAKKSVYLIELTRSLVGGIHQVIADLRLGHPVDQSGERIDLTACALYDQAAAAQQVFELPILNVGLDLPAEAGARVIGPDLAAELLRAFLDARFSGAERHRRRLQKVAELERERR